MRERPYPILESPTNGFLLSKLSCNLPIGYFFSTTTHNKLSIRTFAFYRIRDDRAIGYGFPAMWADNLIFHLQFLLGTLVFCLIFVFNWEQIGGLLSQACSVWSDLTLRWLQLESLAFFLGHFRLDTRAQHPRHLFMPA
jgi:hypothetical protein